jgi:hypothetical protein
MPVSTHTGTSLSLNGSQPGELPSCGSSAETNSFYFFLNVLKAPAWLRIGLLLMLLVGEVAWIASLRAFGWGSTNAGFVWALCLVSAILPLIAAAIILAWHRMRFSSRTMLVAMTLVAVFLFLTIRPLQTASASRRASRALLATGATLHTMSSWDSVYGQLGYNPRISPASAPRNQELTSWLRPLAGSLLKIPPAYSIREMWLSNDTQIETLCTEAGSFLNLERVEIGAASSVTPSGLECLRQALPRFERLCDLQLDVDLPADWFHSLARVYTLSLWAEGRRAGSKISVEQLRNIVTMPDLRVLYIFRYPVTDSDIQILSASKSLRYLILKKTAVTEVGEKQLSAAMPDCVIHRD